jgi:hypothetical protein
MQDACRFRRNLDHVATAAAPKLADNFDRFDTNSRQFA